MNNTARIFILACLVIGLISPAFAAQPTKESLLAAWESLQKNDPETVTFEKLAEKHYRYKTNRLPFDGELKVHNLIVENRGGELYEDMIWGIVELELLNLPEDFQRNHLYSYAKWQQNNTLFFDNDTQEWLPTEKFAAKQSKEFKSDANTWSLVSWIIPIAMFAFVLFLYSSMGKLRKKSEINMQKSFAMAEETNRLLKEILEELRKK